MLLGRAGRYRRRYFHLCGKEGDSCVMRPWDPEAKQRYRAGWLRCFDSDCFTYGYDRPHARCIGPATTTEHRWSVDQDERQLLKPKRRTACFELVAGVSIFCMKCTLICSYLARSRATSGRCFLTRLVQTWYVNIGM